MQPIPPLRAQRLRPTVLAATLALLGAAPLPALAQAAAQAAQGQHAYDIPAQPLGLTLTRIATESGQPVSVDAAQVAGITAPAVRGSYTAEQAVRAALAGSGLAVARTGSGALTVVRAPAASAAPAPTLGEVRVAAEAERSGTTEGTGSYKARYTNTATNLSLSPRETPQTVSVVTRQQMDDFSMTSVDQALKSISGVVVNEQIQASYFYSRGFQMQTQYDGVANPLGVSNGDNSSIDSAFVDRIDVVQGASGLMAGAGEPGGTINLIRKRPTEAFQAQAEVQLGSWNQKRIVGDVSGPLIESGRIRGRLVAVAEDRDSFIDYSYLKRQGVYGVIDADISPTTRVSASFQYQHDRVNTTNGVPMASDGSDLGLPRSTYLNSSDATTLKTYGLHSVTLEQELPSSWKAKAGIQHSRNNSYVNDYGFLAGSIDRNTGDGASYYGGSTYKYASRYDAFNVSIGGPVMLFGRKHEIALGATGSNWEKRYDGKSYSWDGIPINIYTFDPHSIAEIISNNTVSQNNNIRQTGIYASGKFEITDSFKAIIGTRASWYKSNSSTWMSYASPRNSEQSESGVISPYAGLIYNLSRQFSVYASYSDIFTPSTYQGTNGYLKPVIGKNYEAGIKGELLEGRLNVAAAIFRLEQVNLAKLDDSIPYSETNACGGYCYTAADKVVSQGIDLSANGEITPGWNLAASYTYVNSKYASGENDGQRFMTTLPQHNLRLAVNHRLPDTGWSLGGSVRLQSKIYNGATSWSPLIRQDGYALADLTAKYAINPKADLLLAVNNLFDKRYYASVYGAMYVPYGEPRKVSATLKYYF